MTLESFLLHETSEGELCAITSHGYIEQTAYIDHEDLFIHGMKNTEKHVKSWHFGTLVIYSDEGRRTPVPVKYIEIGD